MDKWLEAELEVEVNAGSTKPSRLLVFSHVPPFIRELDEGDEYFNLESGFRQELLARMTQKGVVAWFSGHYHRNAGGVFRDSDGKELEVVVTAAVGTQIIDKPGGNHLGLSGIGGHLIGEEFSGFRLVKVHGDRIEHEWKTFAQLKDVSATEAAAF